MYVASLFLSYSHKDEEIRNELEIHLTALKRQGIIDVWHDRRIKAGGHVENQISEHLEKADLILLLISSDFIASDYCHNVEMKRAMERHENGQAKVIPVILRPCEWHNMPFGKLMATPTDGKPITKFPNLDEAFLEVTKAVRKTAEGMQKAYDRLPLREADLPEDDRKKEITPNIRSSNLRIKKTFTDLEKDKFLTEAFEYIANFFEGSFSELKSRNREVNTNFRRIDANHFTASVYIHGSVANSCRIWLKGRNSFPNGITYSTGSLDSDNSWNECISVDDDGYAMFLTPSMNFSSQNKSNKMSFEGGAEYFWAMFIEPLQH